YSWSRSASLLGIGKNNFIRVAVDEEFRMVPDALDAALLECQRLRRPVWQIVAVAGTTEFGSVDPIDEIVAIRDAYSRNGLYAPIHVDGAYGGYFSTMFVTGQTGVSIPADLFSGSLERAFKGISGTDSVTVDPHKAGYTP